MLQTVTLANLAEGRVEGEFQLALLKIMDAWQEGRQGPATITLTLKLAKDEDSPFVSMVSTTKVTTPDRKQHSILALKDDRLQVETTNDDARQPGMFEPEDAPRTVAFPGGTR